MGDIVFRSPRVCCQRKCECLRSSATAVGLLFIDQIIVSSLKPVTNYVTNGCVCVRLNYKYSLFTSSHTHVDIGHTQIDGDVRLAGYGANRLRGKLEIFYNGTWGRVCARPTSMLLSNTFELDAANVICRQLGLGFAASYSTSLALPEQRYTVFMLTV